MFRPIRYRQEMLKFLCHTLSLSESEAESFLVKATAVLRRRGLKIRDIESLQKGMKNSVPIVKICFSKWGILSEYILSFNRDAILVDFTDCTPVVRTGFVQRRYLVSPSEESFDEDTDDYEWKLNHSSLEAKYNYESPDSLFDPRDE